MKKSKRPRNTIARKVSLAAQADDLPNFYKAFQIATYGRPLTEVEELFRMYYESNAQIKKGMKEEFWKTIIPLRNPENIKEIIKREAKVFVHANLIFTKAQLEEIFTAAMDGQDFQAIQELADAVRFLKEINHPFNCAQDNDRRDLLAVKFYIMTGGRKMTMRDVAAYLGHGRKSRSPNAPDDGFSALRRKCKEIKLPLVPSRKISKK